MIKDPIINKTFTHGQYQTLLNWYLDQTNKGNRVSVDIKIGDLVIKQPSAFIYDYDLKTGATITKDNFFIPDLEELAKQNMRKELNELKNKIKGVELE